MMKLLVLFALLAFSPVQAGLTKADDRTITKVVKLLQTMMEKSKKEGDDERTIYAKFKCYCDQSEAEKRASIKKLTKQMEILESEIAEIQGKSGELSSETAALKVKMADNEQAQADANSLRSKENKAFTAEEQDLLDAIAQMKEALEVLAAVGGDQTKSTGADNKQFMAGKKMDLISLQSRVQDALKAASALMTPKQHSIASAFIQAPFTGTYSSQSGAVVGILKEMRDTFTTNLASSRDTEKKAAAAHKAFIKIKEDAFESMKGSYEEKQKQLGDNDGELSSKKQSLKEAEEQKASDEEFLDKMVPMCEEKGKGYSDRKLMRANEEAAIAEAISILNSDSAFATFGTTGATKTGKTAAASLAQMRSVTRHESGDSHVRLLAQKLLEQAATEAHSARLVKVAALLKAENPFDSVLEQITKMVEVIGQEAKADKKNLDFCTDERKENNANLDGKNSDITRLEESIDKLKRTIGEPETGLKDQIAATEESLLQNTASQKTETAERTEDNVAYQANVRNLVDSQSILKKSVKVLKAYYDDLEEKLAKGEALMQEDPDAPEAWKGDGSYAGQKDQGGDVIKMLSFILSEAGKEESKAHADEEKAQAAYEDSMTMLKEEEAKEEKSLANLHETLAQKEKELLSTQEDLKKTTEDRDAIEVYLAKIKPGCDFIAANFDQREAHRKTEKEALEKAVTLIQATPAYKTAKAEAKVESFGDCQEPCTTDEANVKCKACMAKVTVPAYCAGHKGTAGC